MSNSHIIYTVLADVYDNGTSFSFLSK